MTTDQARRLLLLKIGGSLITRREQYCTLDLERLSAYVLELQRLWQQVQGRLVLVLGGGSFGHNTVERFNLHEALGDGRVDANALTINMMTLKLTVARELAKAGVPCYPFQTSSFVTTEKHAIKQVLVRPIFEALRAGLLPVLSGDLVFDTALGHVLFSSDRVPEVFLGQAQVERIVVLTDVPGVLSRNDGRVIQRIDEENLDWALDHAGPSEKRDVTGGMRAKLRSLISAAEAGVPSVIADGRSPARGMAALMGVETGGTNVVPFVRRAV